MSRLPYTAAMPLNDALERWFERQHPQWLRSYWPALLVALLLLLAALLVAYVNTAEILPPEGSNLGGLLTMLARLRGRHSAILFLGAAELTAALLLVTALQARRALISPPADLRLALSIGDYRSYARSCLDGVEESTLLWALPLSSLLVYGTAWLLHFIRGGLQLGFIGLPALALLLFKAFVAVLAMLLLLRPLPPTLQAACIAVSYLVWWAVDWLLSLLAVDGVLDLGLPVPYVVAIIEILVAGAALAIVLPMLHQRRAQIYAAFGKLV